MNEEVLELIKQDPFLVRKAAYQTQDCIRLAVSLNAKTIGAIPRDLQTLDICKLALSKAKREKDLHEIWNESFWLWVIKDVDANLFKWSPKKIRESKEFMTLAVQTNPFSIKASRLHSQANMDLFTLALTLDPKSFAVMQEEHQSLTLTKQALKIDAYLYKYIKNDSLAEVCTVIAASNLLEQRDNIPSTSRAPRDLFNQAKDALRNARDKRFAHLNEENLPPTIDRPRN